jgi:hypothetical protein
VSYHSAQEVDVSERHGGEDVVVCASSNEEVHDVASRLLEAGGPSDGVQLMRIPRSLHVRAGIQERANGVERSAASGQVERKRVVSDIANVRIGPPLEEELDCIRMPHGDMKSGRARMTSSDEIRLFVEENANLRHIARTTRSKEALCGGSAAAVHLGLQGAPAGEPTLSGHGALSIGQPGFWFVLAERSQPLLCQLLQVLEGGPFR